MPPTLHPPLCILSTRQRSGVTANPGYSPAGEQGLNQLHKRKSGLTTCAAESMSSALNIWNMIRASGPNLSNFTWLRLLRMWMGPQALMAPQWQCTAVARPPRSDLDEFSTLRTDGLAADIIESRMRRALNLHAHGCWRRTKGPGA
ncbi:hypothetical protein NDU88_004170 [Pleurodeles waltl]|uniref:Uncharacterized protein n=1 Tax=Pleurodeles waltl TaxID=8319 RepID=A0AAV7UG46_PLEWA|nr:hypothetical protein NDU88_004170 [Pleurodeles waltl]